ncbi:hypothetical protein ESB00_13865 [Oleiharenicola lentus]|uniref:Uncharacterized protein n=1 Tax=Oleiharenicola lentus TaxID=2508720 RepID=A0A4Q1C3G1_9BACT|nr:hypothetical protein [Oleiharenicola lentus]RXK52803.1 hypothetical protein ESB00_13865 [Oleiharenicola lentus]
MSMLTGCRIFNVLGGLAVLGLLAGCFETKQEFTLNPDGSGKVVHSSTFQTMDITGGGQGGTEKQAKAAVAELLTKAKGVDAWRDVSHEILEDGRISFKGTAYFRNLSDLDIPNQTMLEFDWVRDGGTGTLSLRAKDKREGKKAAKTADENLTPQQAAAKIKEGRAKYQQMKPMMAMIMGAMKHEVVFHLPGRAGKSTAFQKDGAGGLSLSFDGAKMLGAMDALINDDTWMARNSGVMDPEAGPPMDEEMSKLLFGEKGPVQATVTGLGNSAVFDYEAEVAAAQEEFAALRAELGAGPVAAAAPAQSGELKSVRVLGVRLVREVPEGISVRPFNEEPGYSVALLAELPGSVLALTEECALETAVADDGTDLLPESEWSRRISFPSLSEDKTHVMFDAKLALPGRGVKGIREVSGHLQFTVAAGTKEVDLGFAKFAAGTAGKALEAQIESLDGQNLELKIALRPDDIKALFLVVGGNKTELNRRGYSGFNDSYTYTYESEQGFPAKAKLVVETYADLQTFTAPFKVENLTLLGEPAE